MPCMQNRRVPEKRHKSPVSTGRRKGETEQEKLDSIRRYPTDILPWVEKRHHLPRELGNRPHDTNIRVEQGKGYLSQP